MDSQNVPAVSDIQKQPAPNVNSPSSLFEKIKNMSRRNKILLAGVVGILLVLVVFIIYRQSPSEDSLSNVVIARVGDTTIPRSYLAIELDFYPATPSAEIDNFLTEKIVNDQVTLLAGKKEGLISDYPSSQNMSHEEYLKRTNLVTDIKNKINDQAVALEAEVVSIWFYNNGEVGPLGYEKEKALAFKKINEYYSKVKNKQLTIKQAGEQIASDRELIDSFMNVSLKENSYIILKSENSQPMSFWPEFDAQLRQLNPGEITPIFEGTDTDSTGKVIPNLYAFGQVTRKSGENAGNYQAWLEDRKSKYEITY